MVKNIGLNKSVVVKEGNKLLDLCELLRLNKTCYKKITYHIRLTDYQDVMNIYVGHNSIRQKKKLDRKSFIDAVYVIIQVPAWYYIKHF